MGYSLNRNYELGANQGSSGKASHQYIIAHDTGNDNNKGVGSAKNEASYMRGHWQNAYTHAIVDDQGIYIVGRRGTLLTVQGVPLMSVARFKWNWPTLTRNPASTLAISATYG